MNEIILPPIKPFVWGEWDCFKLAEYIRIKNNLPMFEKELEIIIADIYEKYSEDSFDSIILKDLLEKFAQRTDTCNDFNMVLIYTNSKEYCLGTIINNHVWYQAYITKFSHISRLRIDSIWHYNPIQFY